MIHYLLRRADGVRTTVLLYVLAPVPTNSFFARCDRSQVVAARTSPHRPLVNVLGKACHLILSGKQRSESSARVSCTSHDCQSSPPAPITGSSPAGFLLQRLSRDFVHWWSRPRHRKVAKKEEVLIGVCSLDSTIRCCHESSLDGPSSREGTRSRPTMLSPPMLGR